MFSCRRLTSILLQLLLFSCRRLMLMWLWTINFSSDVWVGHSNSLCRLHRSCWCLLVLRSQQVITLARKDFDQHEALSKMTQVILHIKFRFCDDVELMLGQRPGLFWRLCWQYIRFVLMIFCTGPTYFHFWKENNMLLTRSFFRWIIWCSRDMILTRYFSPVFLIVILLFTIVDYCSGGMDDFKHSLAAKPSPRFILFGNHSNATK